MLPEWGYGLWKSRDVYEHQRDVEDDFDGPPAGLPLDALVLDSPWETPYNTWEPTRTSSRTSRAWSRASAKPACARSSG